MITLNRAAISRITGSTEPTAGQLMLSAVPPPPVGCHRGQLDHGLPSGSLSSDGHRRSSSSMNATISGPGEGNHLLVAWSNRIFSVSASRSSWTSETVLGPGAGKAYRSKLTTPSSRAGVPPRRPGSQHRGIAPSYAWRVTSVVTPAPPEQAAAAGPIIEGRNTPQRGPVSHDHGRRDNCDT